MSAWLVAADVIDRWRDLGPHVLRAHVRLPGRDADQRNRATLAVAGAALAPVAAPPA